MKENTFSSNKLSIPLGSIHMFLTIKIGDTCMPNMGMTSLTTRLKGKNTNIPLLIVMAREKMHKIND